MNALNLKTYSFVEDGGGLPFGVSIECLKRANSMHVSLSSLGFPIESDLEVEKIVFRKSIDEVLIRGDLNISC